MRIQMKNSEEPFVRMVKRDRLTGMQAWRIRMIAVLLALLAGAVLFLVLRKNPVQAYLDMLYGAFGSKVLAQETISKTIPLLITAIGISYAFQMHFWNIGGGGQILMGGIGAAYFAYFYADQLPRIPLLLIMMVSAMCMGGLYGLIPALFKVKFGTNETLFTLMLNYIAFYIIVFLENGPWKAPGSSFPKMPMINRGVYLSRVAGVQWGWIAGLVLIGITWFVFHKTRAGYEIAVVGESNKTARYAGINVGKVFRRTMFFSGAIIGLVGFFQVAGTDHALTEGTAGGVGFTAITVAWLAHMSPVRIGVVALGIAILERGCNQLETTIGIPASVADILIGIILFFMLGCDFFINYRLIFRKKKKEATR